MKKQKIEMSTVVFDRLPEHDTCWAFIEGTDGKLYTGVCGEITGGLSAYVAGYDPRTKKMDYLVEMATAVGHPADNGEATHSKVHKSLLQDVDGTIYAATHCTGAPEGDWLWRPWNCWNHPRKFFCGAGLVAMRPDGEILYSKIILNKEGSRCMALAPKRRKIYGMSYPKNHFFIYDLETRETRDLGRLGNINPQAVFTDAAENGYTTDDFGKIIRYDADKDRLEDTGLQIPHVSWRNGYHNTLYDIVCDPEENRVWGVTWTWGQRLFSLDFDTMKLTDYGPALEEADQWSHIIHTHVGGMVFGSDRKLYFTANRQTAEGSHPVLVRFDPETAERTVLGPLAVKGIPADHIARGALGTDGCLYFSEAGNTPTKLFRCDLGFNRKPQFKNHRFWG